MGSHRVGHDRSDLAAAAAATAMQINITWLVQIGEAQEKWFSNYFSSVEIVFNIKFQDIHMGLLILQSIPMGIANTPVSTLEIPEHLKCQSL